MIIGAHAIINTTNAEADRAFFRDVLGFPSVDVGEGWLIFGMPPSEAAFHPSDESSHEFYLMCDDVKGFVSDMRVRKVTCGDPQDMGWGIMTQMTLPSGGQLGVYQARHARPQSAPGAGPARKAARAEASATRESASKSSAKKGPAKTSASKSSAKKSASKKAPAKARAKSGGAKKPAAKKTTAKKTAAKKPAAKKVVAKKGSKKAKRR